MVRKFEDIKANWTGEEPDPTPGNYYASVVDGGRTGLLLGPFKNHADALAKVFAVKEKAQELNNRAVFYSFGTVRMADDCKRPGLLNKFFEGERKC